MGALAYADEMEYTVVILEATGMIALLASPLITKENAMRATITHR